ncbi:MAG: ABC transporter substrate-binding protein [Candidatus Methanosuratus sp.]|nr:ABC transporter substrate-binding protein [Candidatus Methanosuratincola sp.]
MAMLAAVIVLSLGCISPPEEGTKSAGITTLRIGYQPSTHQIAEMVAAEKGWWKEDLQPFGVTNIEEKEFQSGPPEMQAMLAGAIDIAYVGTAPTITAISEGLDAKIVASVNTNGSDLVLRPDIKYINPKSLEGLSIATFPPGSIQDIVIKKWLNDSGVDISKIKFHGMGPGEAVTAIEAGKVDGVFLPHPSPSKIELDEKGIAVVQSGEMWPHHACCSLLVSGKLLREQPDLVDQIIKTHIKATEYVNANPQEAAEIYAKRTKQDLAVVEASIKSWDGEWVSNPEIQIPSTVEYAKVDRELRYINKSLSADDLFDINFYLQATAPE